MTKKRVINAPHLMFAVVLMLTLSNVRAQSAGCVSAQQHAESEAHIASITQHLDPETLGHNLNDAFQKRSDALDAVKKCQGELLSLGCGREIDLYNLVDEEYKNAAQAIDMYRMLVSSQVNARAMEAPVCR